MRILHINSYYISSPFYENIYSYQRKCCDVVVYAHTTKNNLCNLDKEKCIVGRPYTNLDRPFFHLKHHKIWADLNKKIDLNSFDLIHAHSLFSNGYEAYKAFAREKIPYVVSVRNTDINVFFKYFKHLKNLGIKILLHAKAIIFISLPYKEIVVNEIVPKKYRKCIDKKSFVVPNGVDCFWLDNISNHKKTNDMIKVISVGVIDKNKNQLITCKALQELLKKGYRVSFDIYGRIINKSLWRKITKFSFVNYHQPVKKNDLLFAYRNSDIFVMPSINETFGISYVEAMSQGLPVIYTKNQGFDGQYEDGVVGFSVNPKNYLLISKRIEDCYIRYESISSNCLSSLSKYDWNGLNLRILDIYEYEKEKTLL